MVTAQGGAQEPRTNWERDLQADRPCASSYRCRRLVWRKGGTAAEELLLVKFAAPPPKGQSCGGM
jgi:hypothetical protein